jgi:hypothetical protein
VISDKEAESHGRVGSLSGAHMSLLAMYAIFNVAYIAKLAMYAPPE